MTQSSWPFEGVDTTETQYSRLLRNIGQGVNGVPGDNNLLPYADSSGMNVKVKVSGGNSQAIVRGHMYQSTAEETLSIAAASTSPRIDAVVLTLDPSVNSIQLAIVQGTPAATPSAPTLTQTDTAVYQLLLGYVAVSASATTISASDVTDKRTFLGKVWTTSSRPSASLGLTGYNTTLGKLESWNGTSWEVVTPTSLDASVITSGTIDSARLATTTVAKGGTGATDAGTARSNLGITPGNIGAANASHTHPISDITSLQSALDGKQAAGSYAAASHTHDGSAIVSGNINVPGSLRGTSITVNNGVGGSSVILNQNGNVAVGGRLDVSTIHNVTGNIYNGGAYTTSVAYGAYRALWVNVDGLFGHTASNRASKQDIVPTSLDPDAILDAEIVDFRYKVAVEKEGDKAALEVGVIAEQLIEVGLGRFVFYSESGEPEGVHYERLAIAIIPQLQKQAERITSLEERLDALESK